MISSYLHRVFCPDRFAKLVDETATSLWLWEKENPFDAIAFTGVSGAAMAFPLSVRIGKPLICVRKNTARSHSPYEIEGDDSAMSYIIVDDCVDSGETIKSIIRDIEESDDFGLAELKGIYLYAHSGLWNKQSFCGEIPLIPNCEDIVVKID